MKYRFKNLPHIVKILCQQNNAWILGSYANPACKDPNDIDIIISYSQWQDAASRIPNTATPNIFGGWKVVCESITVDVWPGDISTYMTHPSSRWMWNPKTNIFWNIKKLEGEES